MSAALLTVTAAMATERYKNTTKIPSGLITPDTVQTSIGELNFFDGVPTKETAQKTHDFLDKARGVDAFLKGIPGASLQELRKGPVPLGVDANGKVAIFDKLMDPMHSFSRPTLQHCISSPILYVFRPFGTNLAFQ